MAHNRTRSGGVTRRALVASGVGLAAVAAAGCSRTEGGAPAVQKQAVTIRWSTWGNSANPMVQAVAQWLALFKQQQPHITVEPETQEGNWQEKNLTQWLAGTGPDVSGAVNQFLPTWSRKGLLLVLD